MRHLIARALRTALRLVLPAHGQHRAAPVAPEPTPKPIRAVPAGLSLAPWVEPENWNASPLVRPYVDRAAWLAELDEMQRQYERREALRAVAEKLPDTGHTFPGAHTLAGAVA
ncbi:hypothetical protein PUR61_04825 [Streptomyces sp. BE20]|uniref:hypothetical protein n=1 Tax=unclassified Streptomyces TaxID=2593676 RepID=UPI002E78B973|nr:MULTISPECIES: hypothetical protein [unclassified Streptomyces]MED7951058.1 hypothetical protein [Streptomyces sp. BE303]MEE1821524.1 hypothetical protein [Streptomyces sp. BE20]